MTGQGEIRYLELKRIPPGSLGAYLQQHKRAVHIKDAKQVNKETTVKESGFEMRSFKGPCKEDHFHVIGINPGNAGRILVRVRISYMFIIQHHDQLTIVKCKKEICHREGRVVAKAPEPFLHRIERDAITIQQLIRDEDEQKKRLVTEGKRVKASKKDLDDMARDAKRRVKAILKAERELNEAKVKAVKAASVATEARLRAKSAVDAADLADAQAIQASIIRLEKWEALKELDPDNKNTTDADEPMETLPPTSDFASTDAPSPVSTPASVDQSLSENAQSLSRKRKRSSVSNGIAMHSSDNDFPDYLTQPAFTRKSTLVVFDPPC